MYSVTRFFADETHETVTSDVDVDEAVKSFIDHSSDTDVEAGKTHRVILTDEDDAINMEWIRGQGIVFPPQLQALAN